MLEALLYAGIAIATIVTVALAISGLAWAWGACRSRHNHMRHRTWPTPKFDRLELLDEIRRHAERRH